MTKLTIKIAKGIDFNQAKPKSTLLKCKHTEFNSDE